MKQKSDKIEARITTVQQYSGPLPHPNDLIRYNDAVPNAAERIIAMAESEMQHRHKQEEVLLRNRVRVTYVSIFFSFSCAILTPDRFPHPVQAPPLCGVRSAP